MKFKNLRKAISHVKKLRDELKTFQNGKYENSYWDKYIVGSNIESDNNSYVQFVCKLEAYYYDENGKLISQDMTHIDLRKLPQSMKNQLVGKYQ